MARLVAPTPVLKGKSWNPPGELTPLKLWARTGLAVSKARKRARRRRVDEFISSRRTANIILSENLPDSRKFGIRVLVPAHLARTTTAAEAALPLLLRRRGWGREGRLLTAARGVDWQGLAAPSLLHNRAPSPPPLP